MWLANERLIMNTLTLVAVAIEKEEVVVDSSTEGGGTAPEFILKMKWQQKKMQQQPKKKKNRKKNVRLVCINTAVATFVIFGLSAVDAS